MMLKKTIVLILLISLVFSKLITPKKGRGLSNGPKALAKLYFPVGDTTGCNDFINSNTIFSEYIDQCAPSPLQDNVDVYGACVQDNTFNTYAFYFYQAISQSTGASVTNFIFDYQVGGSSPIVGSSQFYTYNANPNTTCSTVSISDICTSFSCQSLSSCSTDSFALSSSYSTSTLVSFIYRANPTNKFRCKNAQGCCGTASTRAICGENACTLLS